MTITKQTKTRVHKFRNSYGLNECVNFLLSTTSYKQYEATVIKDIIRQYNKKIAEKISEGYDVTLPHELGTLELRKRKTRVYEKDGRIVNDMPIDWNLTRKNSDLKKRIKLIEDYVFFIRYNKGKAKYKNKTFFVFKPNRSIKLGLRDNIRENKIDAFCYGYREK